MELKVGGLELGVWGRSVAIVNPPLSRHFGGLEDFGGFSGGAAHKAIDVRGCAGVTVERDSFRFLPSPSWLFVAGAPKAILTGLRV